jgi:hypothetical protein
MKLNRGLVFAAAAVMVVGASAVVVGCNRADASEQDDAVAMADQVGSESADESQDALGVEQYRGGGSHGGGSHGGASHAGGGAHGGRGGAVHGGGRGFGGRGYGGRGYGGRGWGGRGYGGRGWGPGYWGYCNGANWYCW